MSTSTRRVLFASAITLCAAIAWQLLSRDAPDPAGDNGEPVGIEAPPTADSVATPISATSRSPIAEPEASPIGDADPSRVRLGVLVLRAEDGRPVPGLSLALLPRDPIVEESDEAFASSLAAPELKASISARTDETGVAEYAVEPSGSYALSVDDEFVALTSSAHIDLDSSEREPKRRVFVRAGGAIRGTVTAPDGAPISGAIVRVMQREAFLTFGGPETDSERSAPPYFDRANFRLASTDSGGGFIVRGVLPREDVTVSFATSEHPTAYVRDVVVKPMEVTDVGVVALTRGAALSLVLSENGSERGGEIELRRRDRESPESPRRIPVPPRATVVEIPAVRPGNVDLVARVPGYASTKTSVAGLIDGEARTVEIRLERAARVAGVVVSALGEPVPGARLDTFGGGIHHDATGDDGGRFSFDALPAGPVEITVHADDFTKTTVPTTAPTDGLRIEMSRGSRAAGIVVDASGAPVANCELRVQSRPSPTGRRNAPRTDARGEFSITGLSPGRLLLAVDDDRGVGSTGWISIGEGEDRVGLVLRLEPHVSIRGVVVDASDGSSIEGAVVVAAEDSGAEGRAEAEWMRRFLGVVASEGGDRYVTRSDGVFEFARASPRWRVRAVHSDYRPANWTTPTASADPRILTATIRLERLGRIEGIVRIPAPGTAEGWLVGVFAPDRDEIAPPLAWGRVDASNAFVISGLANGEYELRVSRAKGEIAWRGDVTIAGSGTVRIEVDL